MVWVHVPITGSEILRGPINELIDAAAERHIAVPSKPAPFSDVLSSCVQTLQANISAAVPSFYKLSGSSIWQYTTGPANPAATPYPTLNIFTEALGAGVTAWRGPADFGDILRADYLDIKKVLQLLKWTRGDLTGGGAIPFAKVAADGGLNHPPYPLGTLANLIDKMAAAEFGSGGYAYTYSSVSHEMTFGAFYPYAPYRERWAGDQGYGVRVLQFSPPYSGLTVVKLMISASLGGYELSLDSRDVIPVYTYGPISSSVEVAIGDYTLPSSPADVAAYGSVVASNSVVDVNSQEGPPISKLWVIDVSISEPAGIIVRPPLTAYAAPSGRLVELVGGGPKTNPYAQAVDLFSVVGLSVSCFYELSSLVYP